MPATKKNSPQELTEKLLRVLESQRRLGAEAYPLPLQRLRALTDPSLNDEDFYLAVRKKTFQEHVITVYSSPIKSKKVSPQDYARREKRYKGTGNFVALKGDVTLLTTDHRLLIEVLRSARTEKIHAHSVANLKTGLNEKLQHLFQETVETQMANSTLPEGVAWIWDRTPKLFLLEDMQPTTARRRAESKTSPTASPPSDFATAFAAVFDRLDRKAGGHNFVSLVDLRRELANYSRDAFDNGLRALRLERRFDLSAAEGRHGISQEEQQAGIREGNTLLLHVSRIE